MSAEMLRPDDPTEAVPPGRFAWLREKPHRRSMLVEVQAALAQGRLDALDRSLLIRELEDLRRSGDLSTGESARVERIFRAIAAQEAAGGRAALGQGAI